MGSITSWTRIEPRTEREDLVDALAARLHDPLWQLARQWQIGEFTAEDTGSPVQARARVQRGRLTRFRAGPAPSTSTAPKGVPYDARTMPLEALVEAEPDTPTARWAAVAGLRFVELLAVRGVAAHATSFATAFPLQVAADDPRLDAAGRRFLAVMAGRAPDGIALRRACRAAPGTLPAQPPIPAADRETVTAAIRSFVAWYDAETRMLDSTAAWQRERMEYEFAVAAPLGGGEIVLDAPEYASGQLDWATFDVHGGTTLGAKDDEGASTVTRTVIPSRVSYRGMPAARWWQFEDARVDFGQVEAGPTDLLRLLLVAFAIDYGNDWFVVPVELDVGAVYRVESLVVIDSFGQQTLVRHASQVDGLLSDWRIFSPTPVPVDTGLVSIVAFADTSGELMVLAPTTAVGIEGDPIEDVALLRDEMANLAWAVERVVEGAAGGRIDRTATARRGQTPVRGDGVGLRYRLSTTVPENWVPLVPVRVDPATPDVRLRRGRVLLDRDGEPVEPVALGRLLDPGHPLDVREEEVPRGGATVTRSNQLTRWVGGTTHRWVGRRKRPGRGEAWSGLRFDIVEPDT
jgi:hypothetical protein